MVAPESPWLSIRREYLTGTDAAAICKISPWKSPFEVWAEKRGLVPAEPFDSEAGYWGRELETPIMRSYRRRTARICNNSEDVWRQLLDGHADVRTFRHVEEIDGQEVETEKTMLFSKELEFCACTPDFGIANYTYNPEIKDWGKRPNFSREAEGPGMGDVKTTSARAKRYWTKEGWEERLAERPDSDLNGALLKLDLGGHWMPPDVYLQLMFNMWIAGLEWGSIAALFGGQSSDALDVLRDDVIVELMLCEIVSFHTLYFCSDDEEAHPPMVGLDGESELLKSLYGKVEEGREVTLGSAYADLESEKRQIGSEILTLQKEQKRITNELKAAMGEASVAHLEGSDRMLRRSNRHRGPSEGYDYIELRSVKVKT